MYRSESPLDLVTRSTPTHARARAIRMATRDLQVAEDRALVLVTHLEAPMSLVVREAALAWMASFATNIARRWERQFPTPEPV